MLQFLFLLQLQAPIVLNKPLPVKREIRDSSANFIVLHYDDGNSYSIARRTLIRRKLSYHYYVQRDGKIIKMVDPKYRASHVGLSYYKGYVRLNKYSIGICLQNNSKQSYTEEQYKSTAWLVNQLQTRYNDSTSAHVIGHSDVALPFGRKIDPGELFDWAKLKKYITEIRNEQPHSNRASR